MLGAPKDDSTVDWTTTALWIELVPIISISRIVTGRYGTYVWQWKVIQPVVTYVNIMWYKFIWTFITYNLSNKTIIVIFIILVSINNNKQYFITNKNYLIICLHNYFCTVVNHTVIYIISYNTFIYIYIHHLILYEFNYNYDFHD